MRLRMWAAAVAAVVGLAASASAQYPARGPVANAQAPAAAAGQPAPAAQPAPAPVAGIPVVAAPAGPAVVAGTGGCTNCGTASRAFLVNVSGGYFGTNCPFGQRCNNGAGSFRSDAGFVLGTSKSFFAPCGPELCGPRCNTPVLGRGACAPFNPCVYDSYLNH